jgi:hypothetical protein
MTPLDNEPSTIFENQTSAEESVGLTPRCYDFASTESTSEKSVVVMLRTRRGSVRGTVNDSTLGWKQHRGRIGSNHIVYREREKLATQSRLPNELMCLLALLRYRLM